MEEATTSGSPPAPSANFPPGSRLPALAQAESYLRDPIDFPISLRRRYGDIFTVSFPFFERLVYVTDPALIKELFTTSPEIMQGGAARAAVLEPSLGANSLFTLDGAPHMRQRKLLLPPFHGERIQRYGELMREVTLQEMESWQVGEPFALHPYFQRITLAVIMRSIFGVHDEERLVRLEHLIETFSSRVGPISALPSLRQDTGRLSPWTLFLESREALDAFIYEEIALRRAELVDSKVGDQPDDVLSLLLSARHDDGSPMSDEELRDELVTLLTAGHETAATGLSWAMERLLRNPRPLAQLKESLAAGEVDYLDAAIKETLRARPVIGDVGRKLAEPMNVGGYDLPAGTMLMAPVSALHYREDLFPDPHEFRPERFLENKASTYAWIPFGGGVRRCIGAAFAEYEMRVVLQVVLERAELSAPDPEPEKAKFFNTTLTPTQGALVRLDRPMS
jgi:cytochrome P450